MVLQCFLEGLSSSRNVELKNNEKLVIGRSKLTKIKDSRVSRHHLELKANFANKTVLIKQIGPNNSALNGSPIGIGLDVTAKEGDKIDLIVGEFQYKIWFVDEDKEPVDGKRNGSARSVADDQPPPKKIAKMFLPKGQQSDGEQFRKDQTSVGCSWENIKGNDLLIYFSHDASARKSAANIAAFDMDGTIITTKSGRVFPRDDLDWRFLSTSVVPKLQTFVSANPTFKVVIFTNQAGLEKHGAQIPSFKKKVENIVKLMGIPVIVFIGTGKNEFRKPMTGAWDVYVRKFNEGIEPDRKTSFYCGDAAGRKKDHSVSDRLFALNLSLPFQTPEEFFQGQKPQDYNLPTFHPGRLVENNEISNGHITFPHPLEMIIMVGYPGSGKSSFVKSVLLPKSYVHVNRDTMKSMPKCISIADKTLADGTCVVVDNTNGTKKARDDFIKIGKKHNCPVRCFKMMVDFTHAQHNNRFRQLTSDSHEPVPMVAFNTFRSQFEEPSLDEGFVEVVEVQFVPKFANDENKELYSLYLIEK